MSLPGPAFYDDPDVFQAYVARRARPDSPNDTLEKPAFLELLGDFTGQRVLDLGCGDAAFGPELLRAGAAAYVGVEGSANMVALAEATLAGTPGQVIAADLETWSPPPAAFEVVVSRLVLHYLPSLAGVFALAHRALRSGGRFVFSVEHPVITSSDQAWGGQGLRQNWIVDNYFDTGRRETAWMGGRVVKYHHPLEAYCLSLQQAGFVLEGLREGRPAPERFTDPATFERRRRIPLFLLLAACKS